MGDSPGAAFCKENNTNVNLSKILKGFSCFHFSELNRLTWVLGIFLEVIYFSFIGK